MVAPITPRNYSALCEVTGHAALRDDPRFATLSKRSANWGAMMTIVEQWTYQRPLAECLSALEAAGVPCAAYNEPGDALTNQHLVDRGLFSQITDAAGPFTGVNPPWRMSGSNTRLRDHVPEVGEHSEIILRETLGLTAVELQRLHLAGVFGGK